MRRQFRTSALLSATALALLACGGGQSGTDTVSVASQKQMAPASASIAAMGMSSADYTMVVQQLYVSYFGRPADPGGLKNFSDVLFSLRAPTDIQGLAAAYSTNAAIKSIVDSFGDSAESNALYTGTTQDFVNSIYSNVLGRTGDSAGVSFWVGAIASGTLSKANAALSIMAGALSNTTSQGVADGALVRKRIQVATAFTNTLIANNLITAYAGNQAAASARGMLSGVNPTGSTTTYQVTVNGTNVAFNSNSVAVRAQLPAEGFWTGRTSNGWNVTIASLENGEVWGLYGVNGSIYGVVQGNLNSSGSTVSGTGRDYYIAGRTISSASLIGSVTTKSTLNVTTSNGVSFNGTYQPMYEQMASLPAITGTFMGRGVSGTAPVQALAVTISPTGAIFAGSAALGCQAMGTIKARSSLKNIFDVSVTFQGPYCALGNTTTTGIGVYDTTVSPAQFYVAALKADKSDGFLWVGSK